MLERFDSQIVIVNLSWSKTITLFFCIEAVAFPRLEGSHISCIHDNMTLDSELARSGKNPKTDFF